MDRKLETVFGDIPIKIDERIPAGFAVTGNDPKLIEELLGKLARGEIDRDEMALRGAILFRIDPAGGDA